MTVVRKSLGVPSSTVNDTLGVSVPLQDQAGNQLVNVPTFQANALYPAGYCIQQAGIVYSRNALGTSGVSFVADAANWTALGGSTELGYAEITSTAAITGTITAVAGLSVTVTVGSRPVAVRFSCESVQISTAGNFGHVRIQEDSTDVAFVQYGVGAANECYPVSFQSRRAPAAGSHTYRIAVDVSGTVAANDRLLAAATAPASIQVVQL